MRRYHSRRSTTSFFAQIWLRWPCRAEGRDFKTSGKLGCGVWDFWMVQCRVFIKYTSHKFSAKYLQMIWVDKRCHPLTSSGCPSSANAVYVTRFVGLLWPGHWCTHRRRNRSTDSFRKNWVRVDRPKKASMFASGIDWTGQSFFLAWADDISVSSS